MKALRATGAAFVIHSAGHNGRAVGRRAELNFEKAREFAKNFYRSKAWQPARDAYAKSVGGLCERCLGHGLYTPGEIVHHRTELTPENITDPNVALSWDNLELLCRGCHAKAHDSRKRYSVDEFGRVTIK